MIVADASVVVDFLRGPGSRAFDRFTEALRSGEPICAPHLLDVEVAQTLRRFDHAGDMSPGAAEAMLMDFLSLPVVRYPHPPLLERSFGWRRNVTAYDGVYLALAELLDCPLVTGDSSLTDVPGCGAVVELVSTPP